MVLLLIIYTDWLVDHCHYKPKWVGQVKLEQEEITAAVKDVADKIFLEN